MLPLKAWRYLFRLIFAFFLASVPKSGLAHPEIEDQIDHLTKLIEEAAEGSGAELFLQRGELCRVHEEWDVALYDFERAAALDPSLAIVRRCRGRLFQEMGEPWRALAELDEFLDLVPQDAEGLMLRARVRFDLGKLAEADRDYAESIRLSESPRPELYLERVGAIQTSSADAAVKALAILDEGIERLGPLAALELPAIEIERRRRNFDGALARIDLVRANGGSRVRWLKLRGDVLVEAGRPSGARLAYLEAREEYSRVSLRQKKLRPFRRMKAEIESALRAISATVAVEERKEQPE